MRIIDLTLKDLYQIVRDWKTALITVAMPVLFTLMFGFIFGGTGGDGGDPRMPVGVLNLDSNNVLSAQLVTLLDTSDIIRPVLAENEEEAALAQQVADGDLVAALVIPAGYGNSLQTDEPIRLRVIAEDNVNAGHVSRREIEAMVTRLLSAVESARLAQQALIATAPDTDAAQQQAAFNAALADAVAAWENPPFTVTTSTTRATEDETDNVYGDNAFIHSSAGMMAQFAIAGLMGAAEVVVVERKSRTLQRMLTTELSKTDIITGHFMAMFVMIFTQLFLLTIFGQMLGVNYLGAPLASLLMVIALALFAASLGMLISSLAKSEEQVVVYALIPMFILSGLGGAWMPLEFTPESFQTIAYLTPIAWAMDGLKDITIRGLGFNAVLVPAAILVGWALACLITAILCFRTE